MVGKLSRTFEAYAQGNECGGGQESNLAFCICGDTVLTLHYTPTDGAERLDSNQCHEAYGSSALTTELHPRRSDCSDSGNIEEIVWAVKMRRRSVTRLRAGNPYTGGQRGPRLW